MTAVRDELSDRTNRKNESTSTSSSVITWINDLQESERQKLQLTAAYHLEQIRANNLKKSNASTNRGDDEEDGDEQGIDERELLLLQNGIADMRSKIGACISDINSIIEDLRCTLVEELEKEEVL